MTTPHYKGSVSDTELVSDEARQAAHTAVHGVANRRAHHAPKPDGVGLQSFARAAVDAAAPLIYEKALADLKEKLLGKEFSEAFRREEGELLGGAIEAADLENCIEAGLRAIDHHEFDLYTREDLEAEKARVAVELRQALSEGNAPVCRSARERLELIEQSLQADTTSHKGETLPANAFVEAGGDPDTAL